MAAINIPVISEGEYSSFRSIGVISQFPEDFNAFNDLMSKKNDKVCHGGIIPINVNIDFAGFSRWLTRGHTVRKYATHNDLFQYAATIVNI